MVKSNILHNSFFAIFVSGEKSHFCEFTRVIPRNFSHYSIDQRMLKKRLFIFTQIVIENFELIYTTAA
jgi:hypothetical protein